MTEVAGRYGVSRQSVHAWLRHYRNEGPPGLEDRSHKVHAHPWQIPAELEAAVRAFEERGVEHSTITDLPPFGIAVLPFKDPDGVALELTAPL